MHVIWTLCQFVDVWAFRGCMYVCESAELTEILAAAGVLLVHPKEAEAGRRLVPTKRLLCVSECMRLKMSGWFMLVIMLGRGKVKSMGMFTWTMLWVGRACACAGSDSKTTGDLGGCT